MHFTLYRKWAIALFSMHSLLIVLLAFALLVPLFSVSDGQSLALAGLQISLGNGMSRDALVLEYGPTEMQDNAFSDLQVSLALFESGQTTLSHNPNIQGTLQAGQDDYIGIVDASQKIINHPIPANSLLVTALLSRSQSYNTNMKTCLFILQQHENDFTIYLILFQEAFVALSKICEIALFVFFIRITKNRPGNDESLRESEEKKGSA